MKIKNLLFWTTITLQIPTTAAAASNEAEPANYVFASYLGSGLYNGTDNSVFVLNIPMSFKLSNHPEYQLRLTTSFGFYEYGRDQIGELELPSEVGTLAIIPGIERAFPITKQWVLTPYLDLGWSKNLSTNEDALVYSTGIESRYYLDGLYEDHVWVNKLIYVGYQTEQSQVRDSYVKLLTGYDFKVAAYIPLMGRKLIPTVYGSLFWSYNGLDFYERWTDNIHNDLVYEIGTTLYTSKPIDLWISEIQRLGIGYQRNPIGDIIRLFVGTPF